MDSWFPTLLNGLWSITLKFYLSPKFWAPSSWLLCLCWCPQHSSHTALFSGTTRCFKLVIKILCPQLWINTFSEKWPLVLSIRVILVDHSCSRLLISTGVSKVWSYPVFMPQFTSSIHLYWWWNRKNSWRGSEKF